MLIFLGIGIAVAGYFIGEGLKNFKNPTNEKVLDNLKERQDAVLISEHVIHNFIGVKKEDVKSLVEDYPEIPHVRLNGTTYFPRSKVMEWIHKIGD